MISKLLLSLFACIFFQSYGHISLYAEACAPNKAPILLLGDCHIPGAPSENHRIILKNFIEDISLCNTATTVYLEAMPSARYRLQKGKTLLGICALAQEKSGRIGSAHFLYSDVRPMPAMNVIQFLCEYFFDQKRICTLATSSNSLGELAQELKKKNGWKAHGKLLAHDVQNKYYHQVSYAEVMYSLEKVLKSFKTDAQKSPFLQALYNQATSEMAALKSKWGMSNKPFVEVLWDYIEKQKSFDVLANFQDEFVSLIAHVADVGFIVKMLENIPSSHPAMFVGGQYHAEQIGAFLTEQGYTVNVRYQALESCPGDYPAISSQLLDDFLDDFYQAHYADVDKNKKEETDDASLGVRLQAMLLNCWNGIVNFFAL